MLSRPTAPSLRVARWSGMILLLALVTPACTGGVPAAPIARGTISVGSFNFPESVVLAEAPSSSPVRMRSRT